MNPTGIKGGTERIGRQSEVLAISLTTAENMSTVIDCSSIAGGQILIPTGSTITTLTFYSGYDETVVFLPLYTDDPTTPVAVVRTVAAARAYDLPAALFGCHKVKIVANAAGAVVVILKG
jgi:hypothetical protein